MHPQTQKLISQEYAAQRSEEWFELRKTVLSASSVPTALGENPYQKPFDLLLEKCGKGKPFTGNRATEHGNKYEDEARIIYEEKSGDKVHEIGLYVHPTIKWLGGSPDGVSEAGYLIEIKCPLSREIKDEVPIHYMGQLQVCMEVLDLEEARFIQYKPEEITWPKPAQYQMTIVKRDREWFAQRLPIMKEFWDKVLWHREHGIEEPVKKTRKPRERKPEVIELQECEIEICSDDENYLSE
jgi:putative phage-type endonuclease